MAYEIIIPRAMPQIKTEETTMPYHTKPKTTKKKSKIDIKVYKK